MVSIPINSGCGREMERKEILENLKITEAKIRKKTEDAHKKGNELILQALARSKKLEDENEQIIKAEREKMRAIMKKDIEKERQRTIKKVLSETEMLKKKARVNEAKKFFVSKFEEYIHV